MNLDDDGLAALEAGATYYVTWDDCCCAGSFTDVFVRLEYDDVETDFVTGVVFQRSRITKPSGFSARPRDRGTPRGR